MSSFVVALSRGGDRYAHVVVEPLSDNCMVSAWISQSTDNVIVGAEQSHCSVM